MKVTRLIVARHGNTFEADQVPTRLGKTDLPLVASGTEQARLIGRYLKLRALIPDVIFTSELKRTKQTANIAAEEMGSKIVTESLSIFNEVDYGPDENQPEDKVIERIGKDALLAWDKEGKVPSGWNIDTDSIIKSWRGFTSRLLKERYGKTILVVTSNGIARFLPYILDDSESFRSKNNIKISTGSLCVFEHEGSWECKGWNIKPSEVV